MRKSGRHPWGWWNSPDQLPDEIKQYHQNPLVRSAAVTVVGKPRGTVDKTGEATRLRVRKALIKTHGAVCWLCGKEIDLELKWPDPLCFTRDHVTPRSLGGSDALDNQRPAHNFCNSSRGNKERL